MSDRFEPPADGEHPEHRPDYSDREVCERCDQPIALEEDYLPGSNLPPDGCCWCDLRINFHKKGDWT